MSHHHDASTSRILTARTPWEVEWRYLLNETFSGEEIVIPMLETLAAKCRSIPKLYDSLAFQIEEEHIHFQLYSELMALDRPLQSTGFEEAFEKFVRNLDTATEMIFAVQTVFETLSLGAIAWRIQGKKEEGKTSESALDRRIYAEEYGHTVLSHRYFGALKKQDGTIEQQVFRRHLRDILHIFTTSYDHTNIATTINRVYGTELSADDLTQNRGYQKFKWNNMKLVHGAFHKFVADYRDAA